MFLVIEFENLFYINLLCNVRWAYLASIIQVRNSFFLKMYILSSSLRFCKANIGFSHFSWNFCCSHWLASRSLKIKDTCSCQISNKKCLEFCSAWILATSVATPTFGAWLRITVLEFQHFIPTCYITSGAKEAIPYVIKPLAMKTNFPDRTIQNSEDAEVSQIPFKGYQTLIPFS